METLTHLIPLYPTLIRTHHTQLAEISTAILFGTYIAPASGNLLKSASGLHAALHFTGGKAGAGSLWRKSMDNLLSLAFDSLHGLRTTVARGRASISLFSIAINAITGSSYVPHDQSATMPVTACLDQLKRAVLTMKSLLRRVVKSRGQPSREADD
jgi:hypothetical protein